MSKTWQEIKDTYKFINISVDTTIHSNGNTINVDMIIPNENIEVTKYDTRYVNL